MKRTCDNCGRAVPEAEQMYSIRIQMYARAEPLVINLQQLLEDHLAKMQQLVEQMEQADPAEAEAQVHESYTFDLCSRCRQKMHRQLKAKAAGQ